MRTTKALLNIFLLAAITMPTIVAAADATPAASCQNGKAIVNGQVVEDKNGVYCSLTTIPGLTNTNTPVDPVKVIRNAYGVSIGIAAILAIGMIIWAGIEYATVESFGKKSDAKARWEGALWGLALLLGSYLLLRTINIDLINVNLDLGKPLVGELADSNALASLMQSSVTEAAAAQGNAQTAQQQAKKATETIQAQIDALNEKLKDPNLSATERSAVLTDIQYASGILEFRKSDQDFIDKTIALNQNVTSGKNPDITVLTSKLKSEIAALTAELPSYDGKLKLAVEERIKTLGQKLDETDKVLGAVTVEYQLYNRAIGLYNQAKPSKTGLTSDQFLKELTTKQVYISGQDKMENPFTAIKAIEAKANVSQTETVSILKTYGGTFANNIDTTIKARVKCYDIYTKEGNAKAVSSGCQSF